METSEQPSNDDVFARREARRRKILENSKSRLTRITGREHTDDDDKKRGTIPFVQLKRFFSFGAND